jgi:hypothetical protein
VLSSDNEQIDAGELQLGDELPAHTEQAFSNGIAKAAEPQRGSQPLAELNGEGVWERLRSVLALRISEALAEATVAPLGRWLVEDLVLSAAALADSNSRRSATRLGMAETTFRRQLGKAKQAVTSAYRLRSDAWSAVTQVVEHLVANPPTPRIDDCGLFERCQNMLLEEVAVYAGDDTKLGAGLMDISPPTYRRWLLKRGVAI